MRIVCAFILLSAVLMGPRGAVALPAKLKSAYKKEFAFLEATKRQLRKRLSQIKSERKKKLETARGEVHALQTQLVVLRSRGEELAEQLAESKRRDASEDEQGRLLDLMERAAEKVKNVGVSLAVSQDDSLEERVRKLKTLFTASGRLIRRGGQLRMGEGKFFLQDGTLVKGTLVHVGNIATYGLSPQGDGALAPAGSGRLKLWPKKAAGTARALAGGKPPSTLKIFVYESLEKPVAPKQERSLVETVEAGGIIAWIIVGIGALAFLLILCRVGILLFAGSNTGRLVKKVKPLVLKGQFGEAQQVLRRSWGASARVMGAALDNIHSGRERLEDGVSEAILEELPKIERFGAAITVFAAVAPLLGLLGTVTGMISTFDVITEHGTGDPKLLSGGISEALITTQLGLCVAIPTLLIGTLLRGRAMGIQSGMERAAMHLINLALHEREQGPVTQAEGEGQQAPNDGASDVDEAPSKRGGDTGSEELSPRLAKEVT